MRLSACFNRLRRSRAFLHAQLVHASTVIVFQSSTTFQSLFTTRPRCNSRTSKSFNRLRRSRAFLHAAPGRVKADLEVSIVYDVPEPFYELLKYQLQLVTGFQSSTTFQSLFTFKSGGWNR